MTSKPSMQALLGGALVLLGIPVAQAVTTTYTVTSTNAGAGYGLLVGIPSFALMLGITALELLVAGVQAYVFALLTSLYINDAVHLHSHETIG